MEVILTPVMLYMNLVVFMVEVVLGGGGNLIDTIPKHLDLKLIIIIITPLLSFLWSEGFLMADPGSGYQQD